MPRVAPIEGWFRQLADSRVEVFLRSEGLKVRAHGTFDEMNELADWFEQKTGRTVEAGWRVRQGPKPIEGQMTLVMGDVTSDGSLEES